jgi:hypothetical protein
MFTLIPHFSPLILVRILTRQDPFHSLEREGHAPPNLTGPS